MATVSGKRSILLTVGHENWIEKHSKQDSNNYLIISTILFAVA